VFAAPNPPPPLLVFPWEVQADPIEQRFANMVCREHPNTRCTCSRPVMATREVANRYLAGKAADERRARSQNRGGLHDRGRPLPGPSAPANVVGPPLPEDWAERNKDVPSYKGT